MTCGEVLAHITMRRALAGDPKILPEALRRLWTTAPKEQEADNESWAARLDAARERAEKRDRQRLEEIRQEERAKILRGLGRPTE